MNVGHTPGPWSFLIDESGSGDEIFGYDVSAADGRSIVYYDNNDDPQTEANARLIAAAPELLEALQGVLEGLPFDGDESEYELAQAGCTPTEAAQLAKAFAAIARARGEQA